MTILLFCGGFFDVVWIPTRKSDYDRIASLADIKPGLILWDIGSGTANMLFYLSKKYKIVCKGIEVSPLLYLYSKIKSLFHHNVKIYYGNFSKYDLGDADLVYVYLSPKSYKKIANKVIASCKNKTKIIMACWPLEGTVPTAISREVGKMTFFLYEKTTLLQERG